MDLEWNVLDAERGIWWREYEFTRGALATTVVLRGVDGLIVLSPSVNTPEHVFVVLERLGQVTALVATNSHHHLGQREWRARFPAATTYGPPRALTVLGKKLQKSAGAIDGAIDVRPLDELSLPAWIHWEDPPGFKTGETLLRMTTANGNVWFVGDLVANIQRLPKPPLRWLFQLTRSAPGLKLFRMATWLFVADKRAVRSWFLAQLDAHPPSALIPAHGPPVLGPDVAARTRVEVARL